MRAQREHWRAPASEEKRGEEGKGGMERTGAEKGAKRKRKEEGEGGAAGAKEEVRDFAAGNPTVTTRKRTERGKAKGKKRREEKEKERRRRREKGRRGKDIQTSDQLKLEAGKRTATREA